MTLVLESNEKHNGECLRRQGIPATLGETLQVPLANGEYQTYANMDHAATTPCLSAVQTAVTEFLPWYASVHRGAGFASQVATQIYERTRDVVRDFVDARSGDTVIFTRNTTDSFNLLARSLPKNTAVVVFDTEHHAALLPWQGSNVVRVPTPRTKTEAIAAIERTLVSCPSGPRLVVFTGASNVTGEVLPVAEIAAMARKHGARIAVDVAQLIPHRAVSIRDWDVDYLAFSGHKLYAPFGAGVLVGKADWLGAARPYLAGGGATKLVGQEEGRLAVVWNSGPERHEAGSPNAVGVYALGIACQQLARHATEIAAHEARLLDKLRTGLAGIPGLTELRLFDSEGDFEGDFGIGSGSSPGSSAEGDRVATVSFTLAGFEPGKLAVILSAEYGIGVRDGAFCAHIATKRLINQAGSVGQQALRVSLGLGSSTEHIDRLLSALRNILTQGPQHEYVLDDGRWVPQQDTREFPAFFQNYVGTR